MNAEAARDLSLDSADKGSVERDDASPQWVKVADLATLEAKGSMIVKVGRKQILLMKTESGIYACNNRCPHEGYPLKEGTLSAGCVLTCNWHNWKFDLESGDTLIGSDRLRRYPIKIEAGDLLLDVADPPAPLRIDAAMTAIQEAFGQMDRRMEYDRMSRELARLKKAGGDPLQAVTAALGWTAEKFEYGTTHAVAAISDWLTLGERQARDAAESLVVYDEILYHLAWDSLREKTYRFPAGVEPYDPEALFQAIEDEDEALAIRLARGALAAGLGYADLEPVLARAALAHYADFGHAAIWVNKLGVLAERLGPDALESLLLPLVRSLAYTQREDLIPEFRSYAEALASWDEAARDGGQEPPKPEDFRGLSAKQAMAKVVAFAGQPDALYDALLGAAAWAMLHFDRSVEVASDNKVDDNVGWLDFTHAITFANSARVLAQRQPELWPAALLQIACFIGRSSAYVSADQDVEAYRVQDAARFFDQTERGLLDHGQVEPIVSCHLVKTLGAVREEVETAPEAPWRSDILAAARRVVETPMKRKHALRSARQSLAFVELEG